MFWGQYWENLHKAPSPSAMPGPDPSNINSSSRHSTSSVQPLIPNIYVIVPKHGEDIQIKIGEEVIKSKKSVKLLGVTIDNNLNFEEHVAILCKKANQKLHALARVAPFTETKQLLILMTHFSWVLLTFKRVINGHHGKFGCWKKYSDEHFNP